MIIYNVTVNIDHEVHDAWVAWMKDVHIPDVMATGLFLQSRMLRVLADDELSLIHISEPTRPY